MLHISLGLSVACTMNKKYRTEQNSSTISQLQRLYSKNIFQHFYTGVRKMERKFVIDWKIKKKKYKSHMLMIYSPTQI